MLSHHPIDVILEVSDLDAARFLPAPRTRNRAGCLSRRRDRVRRRYRQPTRHQDTPGRGDAERTTASWRVDDLTATVCTRNPAACHDLPGLKTVDGIADLGFAQLSWIAGPSNNVIGLAQYR